jgi:hypothetical protein
MGDLLLPGGGPIRFPTKHEEAAAEDDDRDTYCVCADCHTRMFVGDHDFCPVCRKPYCEECFEDHDCGFSSIQAEATDL